MTVLLPARRVRVAPRAGGVVVVNGVLPPVLPGDQVRSPLIGDGERPLTTLYSPPPSPQRPHWLCSVRRVDDRGGVIDTTVLPALGWCRGIELGWRRHGEAAPWGASAHLGCGSPPPAISGFLPGSAARWVFGP
ncbi:hypothetical protein [Nocardia asiatica]|uniref:hypothetical protein n=1 Tax=Nocardia asiatica TaxID=209252 RepID=UPI0024578C89|nr:hypothetical protein [Nocardia asiatica]